MCAKNEKKNRTVYRKLNFIWIKKSDNLIFLAILFARIIKFCNFAEDNFKEHSVVGRLVFILFSMVLVLQSCEFKLKPFDITEGEHQRVEVSRYDRLESQYLTTSDFSALQQMNTDYPMETRTLIEDVLKLGEVDDPEINRKFLTFYQDSVLQTLISDAESKYANIDDINASLNAAFDNLKKLLPGIVVPTVYMQIGALDQSIIIGNGTIGISIDKYLGEDYPLYRKYYPESQRKSMNRQNIVPDALCFYLMSLYPMRDFEKRPQMERDLHVGKIMWLTNKAMERNFFNTKFVGVVEKYYRCKPSPDMREFMCSDNYQQLHKACCNSATHH